MFRMLLRFGEIINVQRIAQKPRMLNPNLNLFSSAR